MEVLRPLDRDDILRGNTCPKEYENNLTKLLSRANKLQIKWGKQFKSTSGLRTLVQHIAIYRKKGITDPKKIPMKSKHLFCQAVDLEDKDGKLYAWAQQNEKILEEIGLWCELGTRGWLHIQTEPPTSGRRFFVA